MNPTDYFDQFAQRYRPYKGGSWCYEDGCLYRGLQLLFEATGEKRWRDHLHRLADRQIAADGTLFGYDPAEYNIDHILAGRSLFALARDTGDARYLAAAERLAGQLESHPRIPQGNYWHKKRYPHQVWLDGLYMGLPFQIEYALATDKPALVADALRQFSTALSLTATPAGLYVHGYDDSREQRWADPETGRSPAVWARAVGWLAMALVDALALLPNDSASGPHRLLAHQLLDELIARQQPSGLWMQVLDAPALEGNYEESSASAMFAYALLRAARLGLVKPDRVPQTSAAGERALDALLNTRLVTDREGVARMTTIVCVAGLGGFEGTYRDGTPGYYLTERVVADDPKGVGPLMMAFAENVSRAE
ncbi:glycoside hydrolase family 88 protein [Ensifer adhaerens]|uniref:glycoside hydrolase family 88/105 protein n=1 Tax=Ensifer adhaerens TaxID=106592 RepID=UPI001CC043D1|nr:glycoside hydrolase family 88 protein [Ensifer adhaerens]MBZ7926287.1 glycoside hydrolase family 88 protein [Ensifer adhaerens]UAX97353.1 glycoside hydrolase family 88 protein [Ensifer adhaerens]UAY03528.1 glycoside hydrolase family 88 protein [Ensifer adhaerens]UAY11512.1 glycoside hydrolase family 88 protein [Ensifer adhaerens]